MDHTATPSTTPDKVVPPCDAQPKDSTLLFLMAFARMYMPIAGFDNEAILN